MPAYVFHSYLPKGPGLMFEARDLPDDAEAKATGLQILAEHRSAAEVEIWRGEQMIHRERRVAYPRSVGGGEASSASERALLIP